MAPERTAVVTGAGRGIGAALATRLAHEGLQVVIADREPDQVRSLARDIGAHPIVADLSTEDGVETLVRKATEHLGQIDVWVGNAGIDRGRGVGADEQAWSASWDINVMAHVRAARLLVPAWVERGHGRFVVTASAAGLLTMLQAPCYSVSKHAAVAFAEWLSISHRHQGVVVQAICPQGVQTQMLEQIGAVKDILSHDSALTPDDVAEALWTGMQGSEFLILPHPEVASYYAARATDTDRWLASMNRMEQRLNGAVLPTGAPPVHRL